MKQETIIKLAKLELLAYPFVIFLFTRNIMRLAAIEGDVAPPLLIFIELFMIVTVSTFFYIIYWVAFKLKLETKQK